MQLLRFIPIQLTIVLVVGIILGHALDFGIFLPLFCSILFLTILGYVFYTNVYKKTKFFAFVGMLLTLSIGVLAVSLSNQKNSAHHFSNSEIVGNHTWQLKITETLKPTSFSRRYFADVIALDQQMASGQLLINFPADSLIQALQIDDELLVYSELDEIKAPLNPHQFDYKSYLNNLGIDHQIYVEASFILVENQSRTVYGRAAALRKHIISKLKKANFGEAELSIIQALLLGQRDTVSETTYGSYKNAGAVHILAVSGLHIGILLLLLQFLFKPLELLPKGKTIKLIVIVLLLWGFALLAGFTASIVRAVTMFSFVAYAMYLNRPSNTFNILALSMFFILLVIDPKLLFQVGFQMSYAAVFAIVWIYPLLQKLWFPKNLIARKMWQLLSVSVAAQLGVLPISLFYFHQFPGLFFISNLVIIPALGIVLGGGILILLLAILNCLPDWIVVIYDALIRSMNSTIAWVAEQESFVFKNISFDAIQLVMAYTILISLLLFLTKPNFKKVLVTAIALIGFQSYLFYSSYTTKKKESLLVMHQTSNTLMLHQSGQKLFVYARDSIRSNRMATDYQIAERISLVQNKKLRNSFTWNGRTVFRIDSSGVAPAKQIDYLIITESPKLNLARLLDAVHPKQIIADGSNFKSYITRWKKTCNKRKLPFHYTGKREHTILSDLNQKAIR